MDAGVVRTDVVTGGCRPRKSFRAYSAEPSLNNMASRAAYSDTVVDHAKAACVACSGGGSLTSE